MNIPGFSTRAATNDDAATVVELINAAERVDIGETMIDLSDVEADWASGDINLEDDTLLVFKGQRCAAAAQVADERADIDVHPDYRGCGIGAALAEWSEVRAGQQASAGGTPGTGGRIGQTLSSEAIQAVELLRSRGYQALWDSWVLRLADDAPLPTADITGLEIRPFRPEEEHTLYTIIDSAFSEWEGRNSEPFEKWQAAVTRRRDFEPELLLIALADSQPVGAAYGISYPDEGWIDKIAVLPAFRGQGIASALLARLFGEFRSRGESNLRLTTDSRTGALDLYLNLGMTVDQTYTRWSLDLGT